MRSAASPWASSARRSCWRSRRPGWRRQGHSLSSLGLGTGDRGRARRVPARLPGDLGRARRGCGRAGHQPGHGRGGRVRAPPRHRPGRRRAGAPIRQVQPPGPRDEAERRARATTPASTSSRSGWRRSSISDTPWPYSRQRRRSQTAATSASRPIGRANGVTGPIGCGARPGASLWAGVVVLLAALLAGCGGGGDVASAPPLSPERHFDVHRAFRDLRAQVRLGPRPTGSAGARREVRPDRPAHPRCRPRTADRPAPVPKRGRRWRHPRSPQGCPAS